MVGQGDAGFESNTSLWRKADCPDGTAGRWQPGDSDGEKAALWRPALTGGRYEVAIYIPACAGVQPSTQSAHYTIHEADGQEQTLVANQAANAGGWIVLGEFRFDPSADGWVRLTTAVDDRGPAVWFDAVRWTRVGD